MPAGNLGFKKSRDLRVRITRQTWNEGYIYGVTFSTHENRSIKVRGTYIIRSVPLEYKGPQYVLKMLQEEFDADAGYYADGRGFVFFARNENLIWLVAARVQTLIEERGWVFQTYLHNGADDWNAQYRVLRLTTTAGPV